MASSAGVAASPDDGASSEDYFGEAADMFVLRSYEERDFTFGPFVVRALVSSAACTDYDLTGQTVWPGAHILSRFLTERRPVEGQSILELGAGLGLCGLLAAQMGARRARLTDGNEIVVEVLSRNVALSPERERLTAARLLWGDEGDEAAAEAAGPYSVVLAADVVYRINSIPPFTRTLRRFLSDPRAPSSPPPVAYVGFVPRSQLLHDALDAALPREGLLARKVYPWSAIAAEGEPPPAAGACVYEIVAAREGDKDRGL